MMNLKGALNEAKEKKVAIGHFNISEIAGLNGIIRAAKELNLPVIIGASEGEGRFMGLRRFAAFIKTAREELDHPIFMNLDHAHSLEWAEEAARAGFDSILFDGAKLPLEENIRATKTVVDAVKSIDEKILVEGEIGFIGTSSEVREGIPEGVALTDPDEAVRFVKETKVDLFGPSFGNVHGMMPGGRDPDLNIEHLKKIASHVNVPLVLHGGSGNRDEDFKKAIENGISIVHINTEIRLAWRKALEESLESNPQEVAPYKLLADSEKAVYEVVLKRLKLFNSGANM